VKQRLQQKALGHTRNFSAKHDRSRIQEIEDGCDTCPQVHTRFLKHGVSELVARCEKVQSSSRQFGWRFGRWYVPEHIGMGAQVQSIGEGRARYFIGDAMRSLDYLASRADVDGLRIGAAGCSGRGALTRFTRRSRPAAAKQPSLPTYQMMRDPIPDALDSVRELILACINLASG
jgi:hypothetical protein